jgi:hypothetical protein
VAIVPKTSESEVVLRLRRQPVSAAGDDPSCGTDETAMLTILRLLHSLVANNLQLHSGEAARRAALRKRYHAEALRGRMGTFAAPRD